MTLDISGQIFYITGRYRYTKANVWRWAVDILLPHLDNAGRESILDAFKDISVDSHKDSYEAFLRVYDIPITYGGDNTIAVDIHIERLKLFIHGMYDVAGADNTWRWCIDYLYEHTNNRTRKMFLQWAERTFDDCYMFQRFKARYDENCQYVVTFQKDDVKSTIRSYMFDSVLYVDSVRSIDVVIGDGRLLSKMKLFQ